MIFILKNLIKKTTISDEFCVIIQKNTICQFCKNKEISINQEYYFICKGEVKNLSGSIQDFLNNYHTKYFEDKNFYCKKCLSLRKACINKK